MFYQSIRWRLQLWHGLLLVTVLTGFGITAYQLQRVNLFRRVDQELQRAANPIMARLRPPIGRDRPPLDRPEGEPFPNRRGPGGGQHPGDRLPRPDSRGDFPGPPGEFRLALSPREMGQFETGQASPLYYVIWRPDGKLLTRSPAAPAGLLRPVKQPEDGFQLIRLRDQTREWIQFAPRGETVLVGKVIERDLLELRRLAWWLSLAGAGVLVLGLAGGWWLASRAIQPIHEISNAAVRIAEGNLSHRISTVGTENELSRLAEILNSTFARLESAFAQQGRFTADASHELRTPVAVILSQTQMTLARDRTPEEYRETLQACQRAAQRMRQLIESLLKLARLDAGQEGIKREPFDLARTTRECLEMVRPLAVERDVQIVADLEPADCLGDAVGVGQVITNLVSNAVYYNREHGEVRATLRTEAALAVLTVADTGRGIPQEDLPHIFERFYRVDKSRSRASGRAGLGLAIAKAIVDMHGGRIEVSSKLGTGTVFTIRLPTPK